jgi:hypothetical protein
MSEDVFLGAGYSIKKPPAIAINTNIAEGGLYA